MGVRGTARARARGEIFEIPMDAIFTPIATQFPQMDHLDGWTAAAAQHATLAVVYLPSEERISYARVRAHKLSHFLEEEEDGGGGARERRRR